MPTFAAAKPDNDRFIPEAARHLINPVHCSDEAKRVLGIEGDIRDYYLICESPDNLKADDVVILTFAEDAGEIILSQTGIVEPDGWVRFHNLTNVELQFDVFPPNIGEITEGEITITARISGIRKLRAANIHHGSWPEVIDA